jgi:hypothetical protein
MKLSDIFIKEDEEKPNDKEVLTKLFNEADEADQLKVYVAQETFEIKLAKPEEEIHVNFPGEPAGTKHAKDGEYILRSSEDVKRIKIIDQDEFETYELLSPEEKPDAEGFNTYRTDDEVVAFQYTEKELLSLNISGHFIKIQPDSYVGHPLNDPKKLIVKSKTD